MDKYIAHLEEQNQELQQRLANAEKELFLQSALKPHWTVPHVVEIRGTDTQGPYSKVIHPYGTAFYEIGYIEHDELYENTRWSCLFDEPLRSLIPIYIKTEYETLEDAKFGFENAFWNHVYANIVEDSFGHFASPMYEGPIIKVI